MCFLAQRGLTRYRIHLPIYNGFKAAAIGVTAAAGGGSAPTLKADPPPAAAPAPILFYGTSIVNGHVASRPGMIFTNVLSRALGRDVVNLGFGGEGTISRRRGCQNCCTPSPFSMHFNRDGERVSAK